MDNEPLDIDTLKKFEPLRRLNEQQLILLETQHEVKEYKTTDVIMAAGSADNVEYFLLQGKLQLTAKDGRKIIIDDQSKAAKNAIAHLQPRQYEVTALEDSRLLQIDWSVLAQFVREAPKTVARQNDEISEFNSPKDLILDNFREDLANNTITLPSLPDSALRVNELIDRDECSSREIAKVISQDPAMAVKLITASNSPLFRGLSSVKSCEDAVSRLGLKTTQRLLRIYMLRDLFVSTHAVIRDKMRALWAHSEEVAAIAYVLAGYTKDLSPDQAMLAGLIHDVGAIPLLNYIQSQKFLFNEPDLIDEVVNELKAEVGKMLLEKWHWPEDLVEVAANAENWQYQNESGKPDYIDLVVVSQLLAATGKAGINFIPPLSSVVSFSRMDDMGLTPDKSAKIINDAHADIEEAHRLLQASA